MRATQLSVGARKQAQKLRRELQRDPADVLLSGNKMRSTKSLAVLQAWCEEQDIGAPLRADGSWRFDGETLFGIEQALKELQLAPLDAAAADTRIGRLRQGKQEYKTLGESPLAHRVLCSVIAPVNPIAVVQAPARWVLDMDWRQLNLDTWDGLLVVENADVFYACGRFGWALPPACKNHLVVYRGHDYRAKGMKALQKHCGQRMPQVYFGDVDPKGMCIALQEGYSHVLLPTLAAFAQHASTLHAPAVQEPWQRRLAAQIASWPQQQPLRDYVQLLAAGKGLLQQAALQLPLVALSLPGSE